MVWGGICNGGSRALLLEPPALPNGIRKFQCSIKHRRSLVIRRVEHIKCLLGCLDCKTRGLHDYHGALGLFLLEAPVHYAPEGCRNGFLRTWEKLCPPKAQKTEVDGRVLGGGSAPECRVAGVGGEPSKSLSGDAGLTQIFLKTSKYFLTLPLPPSFPCHLGFRAGSQGVPL